ncbi:MAG: DUF1273 family protein [Nitrospirae bacterium]|nr:DUF1273 family protein [Nitrospirota bacterium]
MKQPDVADAKGSQGSSHGQIVMASFESAAVTKRDILQWAGKGSEGIILAVTGHRPDKIGGYDETHPTRRAVRTGIRKVLEGISPTVALSGMALGVDQDFAEECISLGIPFVAVVPFRGQENVWRGYARERWRNLLRQAVAVVNVSPPPYAGWKLQRRNEWMVDRCDALLAVYDGSPGGTRNCVEYAEKRRFSAERLHILRPGDCVESQSVPAVMPAEYQTACAPC